MIWKYPDEVAKFIADNVVGRTARELAELTNTKFGTEFTALSMKAYKNNHGLKSGTRCGLPAGYSKVYSPEVRQFLADNITGRKTDELTTLVNTKFGTTYRQSQIRAYVKNQGLVSGVDCRYSKGIVPYNKGKEKYWIGGEETQFQKGQRPHNYMSVGSEVVKADGYLWVKIEDPNRWRQKHILLWEEYNGPVPEGHALIFGDGNKLNFDPENLILVTRGQLAVLNKNNLIQRNAELTKTAVVIADLKIKIGQRRKGNHGKD